MASCSFALTGVATLPALIVGAIFLDVAVQTTLVLGQQAIYALNPTQRSRLNTLYIATFFLGGAAGSALTGWVYAYWGWGAVVVLGSSLPVIGFLFWLSEPR
jgi:predicted MFS family arabinose efflux permease